MAPKKNKRSTSSASSKGKGLEKVSHESHPNDIYPLVLTTATQELFGCRADEDVTKDNPYKLLKREEIIQDIKTKAAMSDFSCVKQIMMDYPEEEILLVFDIDFTYGNCFYLVLTPEGKSKLLEPPEPETPEVVENEVSKTPEPRQWISLGSEQEIEEESVKETRQKLRYKFSRVRRKFGMPVCFSDHNAADSKDSFLECASYQDSKFSIKQMQRDCMIQAVPRLHSSSSQTEWKTQRNISTQYKPRELSTDEMESILNSESLKNFIIKMTPRILHALQQEEIVNLFTDDWKALGTEAEAGDWSGQVSKGLVLHQAFTDQKYTKDKKISSINWHPTIQGVIAVALMEKKDEQSKECAVPISRPAFIVFYCFSDPSNPQLLLECPDDIVAFEFCPSNPNIIAGGCINGQVVLWDISAHMAYLQKTQSSKKTSDLDDSKENKTPVVRFCAVSSLENSHKAPITDIQWLPPTFEVTRTGLPVENVYNICVQIVSCSPDCSILFWDVRMPKLMTHSLLDKKQNVDEKIPIATSSVPETFKHLDRTWKPLFGVSLPKVDTSGEYVPLKFSLEHYTCNGNSGTDTEKDAENERTEIVPEYCQLRVPSGKTLKILNDVNSRFFVGTEEGEIVYTDWKLEKDESGRLHSSKPLFCYNAHQWLVNTIQRSPFFKDIILTIGSWNFAIWKEGAMGGPLVVSQYFEQECTTGCWSLSRPAVFFIGKEDGSLEMWNLLENTSEPAHVHDHITNAKITSIKPWKSSPKQHFLAITDDLGALRVLEIPKTLYIPSKHENLSMKKYFELEEDSLEDYLKREELWTKQKKEEEDHKKNKESEKQTKSLDDEELDKQEYSDYLMYEENILKEMGLWPEDLNSLDA
ncbi:dynein axonemal intermediate chain 3 [Menidia menidia]